MLSGADEAALSGLKQMSEDGSMDYIAMKSSAKGLKKGATGPLIHSKHMKLAAMIAGIDDSEDEEDEDDVDMEDDDEEFSGEDDEEEESEDDEMPEDEAHQVLKAKKASNASSKGKKAYDFDEFL